MINTDDTDDVQDVPKNANYTYFGLQRLFAPFYDTWYTYIGYQERKDLCAPTMCPTAPTSPTKVNQVYPSGSDFD